MPAVFIWEQGNPKTWQDELRTHHPGLELRTPAEIPDPAEIEFALVWMPPPGELRRYPNLRAIFSIGAGVSHILRDPELPPSVPIVRLSDEVLLLDMATYAVHWVIHFHRGFHLNRLDQQDRVWRRQAVLENHQRRVGILGLGAIGQAIVPYLRNLGFDTLGWGRTPKSVDGVRCFHGWAGLPGFLSQTDILVCLLPPTPSTANLLDAERLALLPRSASLINIGRGEIVVDADLIAALDSGHLSGAALDVFRTEPLPQASPYWRHKQVYVTPHAAAPTNVRAAARSIAANILRIRQNLLPAPVVDRGQGY